MGMRNDSGGWSQNYQLSIEYTENIFVVPSNIWSNGFLMPQIGSEDNYVIDNVKKGNKITKVSKFEKTGFCNIIKKLEIYGG